MTLRTVLSAALSVAAPRTCASCDAPAFASDLFCEPCASRAPSGSVRTRLHDGTLLVAATAYEGPVRDAIRKFKYQGRTDLARALAERLAATLDREHIAPAATLVPVPLHPKRLAERGYNQSALIARQVGHVLGMAVRPRALRRDRTTTEQATLSREERLRNLTGAFSVAERGNVSRVVLVDDVVTTGATALACARAVRDAGGEVLVVAALSRAA